MSEIRRYSPAAVIVGLIAFEIIVAVIWLLHSGSNYQESYDLAFSRQTHHGLYAYGSNDDPMPIYFLLLSAFGNLGSPTLSGLRLFSLVAFLLALIMIYLVGSKASGNSRVGILAAVLLAVSPFSIWYASRASVYSWLLLAGLINQYFYVGILQSKRRYWPAYILSGLLALGIHYFFAVILLTQIGFYLMQRRRLRRSELLAMLAGALIFCLALLGWINYSQGHTGFWSYLPYTSKPSATNAFIIFFQFLFGFQSVVVTTFTIAFWPLLVIIALLAVQKYIKPTLAVHYFALAAFLPVLAIFCLAWLWKPLFLSSYLMICLPPFIILISWYLVEFELKALALARNILIATMLIMLVIELSNQKQALSGDYLGALYRPASSARPLPYGDV